MRVLFILSLLVLGRMAPMQNCQAAPEETQAVANQSAAPSHDCCAEEKDAKESESSDCGKHCQNICSAPFIAAPRSTSNPTLMASKPAAIPQLPFHSRHLTVLDKPPIA